MLSNEEPFEKIEMYTGLDISTIKELQNETKI